MNLFSCSASGKGMDILFNGGGDALGFDDDDDDSLLSIVMDVLQRLHDTRRADALPWYSQW